MNTLTRESRLPGYFSLFASLSTLLCCALPSVLVLVGLGATVASVMSALPWLVDLSRQKAWVFGVAGLLIAGNGYYLYRLVPSWLLRQGVCPPEQQTACAEASRFSRTLFLTSVALYCVGFAAAYVLSPIMGMLDQ
jgi:hypothetical protein